MRLLPDLWSGLHPATPRPSPAQNVSPIHTLACSFGNLAGSLWLFGADPLRATLHKAALTHRPGPLLRLAAILLRLAAILPRGALSVPAYAATAPAVGADGWDWLDAGAEHREKEVCSVLEGGLLR